MNNSIEIDNGTIIKKYGTKLFIFKISLYEKISFLFILTIDYKLIKYF